uniref:uncharacterized protein LOC120332252 n=1 Tax=Styela clava TaxID=7725 RepID=UPI00193A35CC|nr:uncharacterized protein LOC120332252 [Styela clava]
MSALSKPNTAFINKPLVVSSKFLEAKMEFVKIILFLSLFWGLLAELKLPAGTCVSKIVKGKLVQVGDCKKNDGSEIARLIQKSLDGKRKAEGKCDFKYDSKCFQAVVYDAGNVTFNDAESICKSMNIGKPANIYDLAHYQMLLTYLRPLIPATRIWIHIWTGMEYMNNQLLLSSGRNIKLATEVWYPYYYPYPDASYTNIVFYVDNPEVEYQGMFNYLPLYSIHGVICEI